MCGHGHRCAQATIDAGAATGSRFAARLAAYRANPMAREAGRWAHLVRVVTRLAESGNLVPLDPDLRPQLPGGK